MSGTVSNLADELSVGESFQISALKALVVQPLACAELFTCRVTTSKVPVRGALVLPGWTKTVYPPRFVPPKAPRIAPILHTRFATVIICLGPTIFTHQRTPGF